jgi:hypothetical protein
LASESFLHGRYFAAQFGVFRHQLRQAAYLSAYRPLSQAIQKAFPIPLVYEQPTPLQARITDHSACDVVDRTRKLDPQVSSHVPGMAENRLYFEG